MLDWNVFQWMRKIVFTNNFRSLMNKWGYLLRNLQKCSVPVLRDTLDIAISPIENQVLHNDLLSRDIEVIRQADFDKILRPYGNGIGKTTRRL